MNTFRLEVVSAESALFSGVVSSVVAPALQGELGVYAGHTPFLSPLKAGLVRYRLAEGAVEETILISGGILEVQPDVVTVVADAALRAEDAEALQQHASGQLSEALQQRSGSIDFVAAQAELVQMVERLDLHKLALKRKS